MLTNLRRTGMPLLRYCSGDAAAVTAAIKNGIRNGLGLRAQVSAVPRGTLPRIDVKAKRSTDHRREPNSKS